MYESGEGNRAGSFSWTTSQHGGGDIEEYNATYNTEQWRRTVLEDRGRDGDGTGIRRGRREREKERVTFCCLY